MATSYCAWRMGCGSVRYHQMRGIAFDLREVCAGELYLGRSKIFLKPAEPPRAGDRGDPRLQGKQPRKRNLRRRRLFTSPMRLRRSTGA